MSSPTEGDCGEPNYTTLAGIPICSECGQSTKNRDMLLCARCEQVRKAVKARKVIVMPKRNVGVKG